MIDIKVLNTNYEIIGIIDTYESFIWTDRFSSPGDFELYTPFSDYILNLCQQDYYLAIDASYHNMIIEDIQLQTNADTGTHLIIKGRSLESILDRRIVWKQTTISSTKDHTLITGVNKILSDAFLLSDKEYTNKRILPNFFIKKPESNFVNPSGNQFEIEKTQFTGDQIDTIMNDICESFEIGYRILFGYQLKKLYSLPIQVWNPTNKTWVDKSDIGDFDLYFELYLGYDRSYDQPEGSNLPYVVFSPNFDNIINTNYLDSVNTMKNVTLVMGEDQGSTRKRLIVGDGEGLFRRELYTDARDLQSSDYGSSTKYKAAMKQRGLESLYENSRITSYEGEVEALHSFIYGVDFFMGDIIQISNEFGKNGKARVIEWVRSESDSGVDVYPTFSGIQIINDHTQEDDEQEE